MPRTEKLRGWPVLLIILWLLILLSMPFIERSCGERVFYISVVLSVLIQAFLVLLILICTVGIQRTAIIAGQVILLTLLIEAIGVATGLPFGDYSYTNRLQPQLLGVPLLIPFAWLMMLPPSWAVARRLSGSRSSVKFIVLSGIAFTAWDLFLDPQMVKWGLWNWERPGGYFGIPWVNLAGWFLTSALITVIVHPTALPDRPLFVIYSLTWLMETLGLMLFWNLKGPALTGFVVMGGLVLSSYYFRLRETR